MQLHSDNVRRYYDENTRLLLTLGQGTEGTIRRAVWGHGVENRKQAMAYVDELVMARLASLATPGRAPRVVDLGAGVCASLCRMARRMPIDGVGVTISRKQVELARERIRAQGLADRVRCIEADYCELPADLPPADLAFAIESFVHAADPARFFEQSAKVVRPGGLLVVCDDFLARPAAELDARARGWIERFRRGWVVGHSTSEVDAHDLARAHGFSHVETLDLTAHVELNRPRDRAIDVLMRCLGWAPVPGRYWSMLYGGHALQHCLKRGWIQHLFVVWARS